MSILRDDQGDKQLRKRLLDRNNNSAILLAGILAIVVGLGVARFAFT
ncbi:MAG: hypothetical protein ACI9RZ_001341, partial [Sphingobacteriales bacterium]